MYNETLNPKIWNNDATLVDGVAECIESIVNQFKKDFPIDLNIADIRLVGSNASYNYNDNSDLDIHLVINFEAVPYEASVLKALCNSYRNKFNNYYNMTVKGLPVELSIEDMSSNVCSNGVYSVTNREWIKKPTLIIKPDVNMTNTEQFIKLTSRINEILSNPNSKDIEDMINQLYLIRKNSILIDGEYGRGNLLFKAIRNTGLLDKLKEELYKTISKELTLEQMLNNNSIYKTLQYLED